MSRRPYTRPTIATAEDGCCYEKAALAVLDGTTPFGDPRVVHGRPTLQRPPFCQYGHAWVENRWGDTVFDPTTDFVGPAVIYYALGRIDLDDCRRYDRAAVRRAIVETEVWGPWEDAASSNGQGRTAKDGKEVRA